MRWSLDISISDPSLTTSKIMRDENPIWNENLTCKVDDVLLHGAYEYIRFDFVENCDERWPSLGGFIFHETFSCWFTIRFACRI